MVVSRDLDVGRVFATSFAPDPEVGFRLAVAGSKGNLQIWDTSTNKAVREAFATRVAPERLGMGKMDAEVEEKLVGLAMSDDDSDDGEENEDEEEEDEGEEPEGVALSSDEE